MADSFRVVNLDRRQFFGGDALDISDTFAGLQGEPLAPLVVWVLTRTTHDDRPRFRGAWAAERVVIAGDGGADQALYFRAGDEFENVTIPLFEEWANWDVFRAIDYWEQGWLGDDGRLAPGDRGQRAGERRGRDFPFERWEAGVHGRPWRDG